jgi:ATP adenylyltransferase/5',5'''-P-1,P-4-tetraphosphate phosphorylase II
MINEEFDALLNKYNVIPSYSLSKGKTMQRQSETLFIKDELRKIREELKRFDERLMRLEKHTGA